MTTQDIEKQLLKLPAISRAKLAGSLLVSLDNLSDAEVDNLWKEEAIKRDNEIRTKKSKAIKAETLFRNIRREIARAKLKELGKKVVLGDVLSPIWV